jgi:glycosyltransferase involved in cell wall biosynthesis
MHILVGAVGAVLGLAWASRVLGAALHMHKLAEISGEEWDRPASENAPRLSVIVPALNEEEHVEAALRSLVAQDYPNLEIIAVNDRSTDATGEIMDRVAAQSAGRLRVLQIDSLPAGWLGKPHAMEQGALAASGEWLLFTDADVIYRADALRRAVAYAEASGAEHLVVFPTLVMHSAGERMMIGFFQAMYFFLARPWKVADPEARDSIGVGAFNMMRRAACEKIGGMQALRMEVVEDIELGRRVKACGLAQRVAFGKDLINIRWLKGPGDAVRNLTKNFFALMQYRWWLALFACCGLALLTVAPYLGAVLVHGWARAGYVAALICILATYIGMAQRVEIPAWYFLLHPVAGALYIYTILRSTAVTLWNGGVTWRGTKYPLEQLRKAAE